MTEQDVQDAIRLRKEGMSAPAIADIYGVSYELIYIRTRCVGATLKEKYKQNEAIIADMYKKGFSSAEIAERVGYSPGHIPKVLKRIGVWKLKNKRKEKR